MGKLALAVHRVDDQARARLPRGNPEAEEVLGKEHEAALNCPAAAVREDLEGKRCMLAQHAEPGLHLQAPALVDLQALGAAHADADERGVGLGREHEVVLDTGVGFLHHHVDPLVQASIPHAGVGGHARGPA
ncbi:MAG: hypothetical protein HY812_12830 [Planctomycetes bacterium]|nr:hypothetical protein [Planctomycetota bacterium]